jgi:hypothetical protein
MELVLNFHFWYKKATLFRMNFIGRISSSPDVVFLGAGGSRLSFA